MRSQSTCALRLFEIADIVVAQFFPVLPLRMLRMWWFAITYLSQILPFYEKGKRGASKASVKLAMPEDWLPSRTPSVRKWNVRR